VSDSKSALQAIQNPARKSGQQMVHKILATADSLRKQRIDLRLLWVPSHSDVPGNEKADKLAKG
jgi:ribonuclease HI